MSKEAREIASKIVWDDFDSIDESIDSVEDALDAYGEKRFQAGYEAGASQHGEKTYDDGIKEAAAICQRFIDEPYTSDTATEIENVRNLILALNAKEFFKGFKK